MIASHGRNPIPLRDWPVKDRLLGVVMLLCYAYGLVVLAAFR